MKKLIYFLIIAAMIFSLLSCGNSEKEIKILEYPKQEFEIGALSSPEELTEEAYLQYKNAGFNVMVFSIHNGKSSSDDLFYLGSNRTQKALEICKKIDLDVYVAYGNSWASRAIEGEDYFGKTPFSTHNYYGEYMDMIKGIRIVDEPNKEKMTELADDVLINDFKKTYPNQKYMINLIPATAVTSRGFAYYDEMLDFYGENIMSKFENPYISVDVYPYSNSKDPENMILYNYNEIAKCAKKYNAEKTFILQASTGREFLDTLSEGDMRQQAYLAIAFGADNLQYYSYSVPDEIEYNYCMLKPDKKTPSELYYHVQKVNNEIQQFSSAVLAYDWEQTIGISGTAEQTYRVCTLEMDENFDKVDLINTKHYVSASANLDLVLSHFTSEEYGEAYMFVNFGREESGNNKVNIQFKDCSAIALYGGAGYTGTPTIISLDENGNASFELPYGSGVFAVPVV